jgi:nucleoside-diphosphate-sugar epimerase
MRFVVIGGTGGIGWWVVRQLSAAGHTVTALGRGWLESELPACDAAVHMHAMSVKDAENFVDALGSRAARLLVAGSGDVYRAYGVIHRKEAAPIDPSPLREDSPLRTVLRLYPEMPDYDKIPVERMVMQAGKHNCVLRLPAVYGPGDSRHRAGGWLKAGAQIGETYSRWRWTHGYIENVAAAVALAAVDDRSAGRIYNVGEAATPTMLERLRQIGRSQIALVPDEESTLNYRQHLVMDSRRIRDELAFTEIVSEKEGLRRTISWEIDAKLC